MNQMDIKFFLTPDEFSMLLASRKISRFYGLSRINYEMSDKDLCLAIHNMYVNNIIQNNDNQGFLIDEELVKMLEIIKEAKKEIVISWDVEDKHYNKCIIEASVLLEELPDVPNQIGISVIDSVKPDAIADIINISGQADNVCAKLVNLSDGELLNVWELVTQEMMTEEESKQWLCEVLKEAGKL